MTNLRFRFLLGTLAGVAFSGALAQQPASYVCTNGNLERRIEVIYETGLLVPCEVHYVKDAEAPDDPQVLWRAANEEGYCEAKAAEFADKLRGWGWSCEAPLADDAQAEQSPDDTEALAPISETETEPR